jgi:hypothetical protein
VPAHLETGRVDQLHRRLEHGDFHLDGAKLRLGDRQEPRVVQGRGRGGVVNVDPERDVEAQQADAATQLAFLAERYEGCRGVGRGRGGGATVEPTIRAVADCLLDGSARDVEEPALVGRFELFRGRLASGRAQATLGAGRRQSPMARSRSGGRPLFDRAPRREEPRAGRSGAVPGTAPCRAIGPRAERSGRLVARTSPVERDRWRRCSCLRPRAGPLGPFGPFTGPGSRRASGMRSPPHCSP